MLYQRMNDYGMHATTGTPSQSHDSATHFSKVVVYTHGPQSYMSPQVETLLVSDGYVHSENMAGDLVERYGGMSFWDT